MQEILPKTSRLHPSPERLLQRAIEVAPDMRVLCPSHMVLHAAAHLFHDGEIARRSAILWILTPCCAGSAAMPEFWSDLVAEARTLDLARPAYYALRNSHRLLDTPVPAHIVNEIAADAPPAPVGWLMDTLVDRTLHGGAGRGASSAAFALYSPIALAANAAAPAARHLLRKGFSSQGV